MNYKKTTLSRIFILFVTLVLVALPSIQVSAALRNCRTDPIFFLSNGEKLTVVLEIGTDKGGVRDIHYILHLPEGVRVLRVVYTTGGIGESETYEVIQDSPKNAYRAETRVNTYEDGVTVTIIGSLRANLVGSATGYNGDLLVISLVQTHQRLSNLTLTLPLLKK